MPIILNMGLNFGKERLQTGVVMNTIGVGDPRRERPQLLRIGQGSEALIINAHRPGFTHDLGQLLHEANTDPLLGK